MALLTVLLCNDCILNLDGPHLEKVIKLPPLGRVGVVFSSLLMINSPCPALHNALHLERERHGGEPAYGNARGG